MPIGLDRHLGTLTFMFLGCILHCQAESELWVTCLQRLLISSKPGSCSALLCQQMAPVLMHHGVKSRKKSSLDILWDQPTLFHGCINLDRASFCAFPEQVLWSCSFTPPFQILTIQLRIFFKVEIQTSYLIFKHISETFFFPIMLSRAFLTQFLYIF